MSVKAVCQAALVACSFIFCGIANVGAEDQLSVHVTGDTVASDGSRYSTIETRDADGNGTDWRLIRERVDVTTGEIARDVVLRSGEKSVDGFPLNAFWSVNAGRIFDQIIPETDEHPAWVESKIALVMPCAGWGGDQAGSLSGVCQFLPDSGDLTAILRDGDEAVYLPSGQDSKSFTVSSFRSPVLSGKSSDGSVGVMFVFADCSDGTANDAVRCIIAVGREHNNPRVAFLNGTDGWQIKMVEIDRTMVVEELPRALGWTAYFKVVQNGVERLASATVLPDGGVNLTIEVEPWID